MERPGRIGDYEVLCKLGTGGMGEVYKVRNVISDRIEAMKVLRSDFVAREDLAARFQREIKVLAALDHPNIAVLRTAFSTDTQLVMIMELVEGQSLASRLAQGRLTASDAVRFIVQVLDAVDYAHRQGVVHRDIKPANMLLTPQGVVKLTDFGIARSTSNQALTAVGATTGSLSYMSPEQVNGEACDARSDLYAVGVSLYEMVTGQLPFRADNDLAVMFAHLQQEPKPPLELQPALAPELNRIILRAMAKKPADRFQTAAELRDALKGLPVTMVGERPEMSPTVVIGAGRPEMSPTVVIAPVAVPLALDPAPAAAVGSMSVPVPAIPTAPAMAVANATPATPNSSGSPVAPIPHAVAQPPQPDPGAVPLPRPVQGGVSPILYVALGAFLVVAAIGGMVYYSRSAEATPSATPAPLASTPSPPPGAATPAPSTPSTTAPATAAMPAPEPPSASTAAAPSATTTSPTATASNAGSPTPGLVTPGPATAERNPVSSPSAAVFAEQPPRTSDVAHSTASKTTGSARRPSERAPVVGIVDRPGSASTREALPQKAAGAVPDREAPLQKAAGAVPENEALDALEAELDQLSARAIAINGSVDRLKNEQARMGYGLNGEMAARQQSLNTNMSKATEAFERKDLTRARRFKALAEGDLQFLEKAFNR